MIRPTYFCPVCGKPVTPLKNGRIRRHRNGNELLSYAAATIPGCQAYPICKGVSIASDGPLGREIPYASGREKGKL